GLVENPQACLFDGGNEASCQIIPRRRRPTGEHFFVDDVHGELARDLAGGSPAHAVTNGNDGACLADDLLAVLLHQASALTSEVRNQKVVFVVLADLTDVGAAEELETNLAPEGNAVLSAHGTRYSGSTSSRNRCWPILT